MIRSVFGLGKGKLLWASGALAATGSAVALSLCGTSAVAVGTAAGCDVFPPNNHWNLRVDKLPVLDNSRALVRSIGRSEEFHADFGSGRYQGAPIGIPITEVGPDQPKVPIRYTAYGDESDKGPFPIPPDAAIEGGDRSDGDRHVIVIQRQTCKLFELFNARRPSSGSKAWKADSGVEWDLSRNDFHPKGLTSADAAGLPILPGLARFEEVQAGEIDHALRMTVPESRRKYIYPATHFASDDRNPNLPAMGQRFRLRKRIDPSEFSPQAAVLIRAMQRYGLIVADNGSPWYVSGEPHPGWDNDVLHELDVITGRDFVAVDTTKLPRP